jgi:hypothetical protein
MSEAKLRRIDNLEIGRYGFGSVTWPGLTDVRRLNFDELVVIDRGSLTVYPNDERPMVGDGLNKEAVVRFSLPLKANKSLDVIQERLRNITASIGGTFCDYSGETWIFRMPHFDDCMVPASAR